MVLVEGLDLILSPFPGLEPRSLTTGWDGGLATQSTPYF